MDFFYSKYYLLVKDLEYIAQEITQIKGYYKSICIHLEESLKNVLHLIYENRVDNTNSNISKISGKNLEEEAIDLAEKSAQNIKKKKKKNKTKNINLNQENKDICFENNKIKIDNSDKNIDDFPDLDLISKNLKI